MIFKAMAMIHSTKAQESVMLEQVTGDNAYIATINGKRYTAIYNPFVDMYYVDDLYGEIN